MPPPQRSPIGHGGWGPGNPCNNQQSFLISGPPVAAPVYPGRAPPLGFPGEPLPPQPPLPPQQQQQPLAPPHGSGFYAPPAPPPQWAPGPVPGAAPAPGPPAPAFGVSPQDAFARSILSLTQEQLDRMPPDDRQKILLAVRSLGRRLGRRRGRDWGFWAATGPAFGAATGPAFRAATGVGPGFWRRPGWGRDSGGDRVGPGFWRHRGRD